MLLHEIIKFLYYICNICAVCLEDKYECNCGLKWCTYHFGIMSGTYSDTKICSIIHYCSKIQHTITCIYNNCGAIAHYGTQTNILYCYKHKQFKMIDYFYCNYIGCSNLSKYINKTTRELICELHIKNKDDYELNYIS